jgi:hypothetical protein
MGVDVGEDTGVGVKDGNEVYEGVRNDGANTVDFGEGDTFDGDAELHELLIMEQNSTTKREMNPWHCGFLIKDFIPLQYNK